MSQEKLTLNDIAALIVQIEPTDLSDLSRVRRALTIIAESSSSSVQKPITKAVKKIDQITRRKSSDPSGPLADIGVLVEKAIDATEKSAEEETSFSTARPGAVSRVRPGAEVKPLDALPPEADPTLVGDFIAESLDLIANIEAALLKLETNPESSEAVNTAFRAIHTIKGTSGFLGLDSISAFTHWAESFFSRIRDKEIRCTGGYADLAFRSVDMLKDLIKIIQNALGGESIVTPDGLDDLMVLLAAPEAADISENIFDESGESTEMRPRLGDILVAQGKADREEIETAATDQGDQPIGLAIVRSGTASLTEVGRALRKQRRMSGTEPTAESSARVRTDRLDRLIEMVGELVIGHSMVAQDETVNSRKYPDLQRKINHTAKIVRQLQDLCMSIRMVPLKATVLKIARLVRDLARRREIMINCIPVGEDTEIDRNMVDLINDPLVHLVRNAVDHGIEPPEEREKNGKPREGTLLLKAYHSGGNVVVEISDDGRGLDRPKIVQKANATGDKERSFRKPSTTQCRRIIPIRGTQCWGERHRSAPHRNGYRRGKGIAGNASEGGIHPRPG
jgi:two-component system chemotaxis sensor kinase CheA